MRTVSLSNPLVQQKIQQSFVPLKIPIDYGTRELPLHWNGLRDWSTAYKLMGGSRTKGFTACVVVTPDTMFQLGSTGSAMVWELFDSIAYDPLKFAAMLDRSLERFRNYETIISDCLQSAYDRETKLEAFKKRIAAEIRQEGRFHMPPRGFSIRGATKLFRLSGDLK
jgi:hypothetical protein